MKSYLERDVPRSPSFRPGSFRPGFKMFKAGRFGEGRFACQIFYIINEKVQNNNLSFMRRHKTSL